MPSVFSEITDPYLRERLADVRDVVIRLNNHLVESDRDREGLPNGPVIIVAEELLPSQAVMLGDVEVQGIVTELGSQTSHAAILARSRGIPAVSGVKGILRHVNTGDTIVVDGREGVVRINPNPEACAAYRKLEREFFDLQHHLAENRDHAARTADGIELKILANINGLADAHAATAMGASGIGLYRTEYLYLVHPDVPDEEEQVATYEKIFGSCPGDDFAIRTLDIGGDKTIPYLGLGQAEANPFMGWRSIRLSFEHPKLFMTQMRAILRAAATSSKAVRVMFPMITTLEEMRKVRRIVRRAIKDLAADNMAYREVPIGMMLEVPAAAITIDHILDVAEFVSIGSNDLVQYLMAADRDNPKVNHLCQPLSPAVLRVLKSVIFTCNQKRIPVTLCGEMAGQPSAFLLLLGMGLRQFSMGPAFIPTIKEVASKVTIEKSESLLADVLRCKTTSQVKRYMTKQLGQLSPDLSQLETN